MPDLIRREDAIAKVESLNRLWEGEKISSPGTNRAWLDGHTRATWSILMWLRHLPAIGTCKDCRWWDDRAEKLHKVVRDGWGFCLSEHYTSRINIEVRADHFCAAFRAREAK